MVRSRVLFLSLSTTFAFASSFYVGCSGDDTATPGPTDGGKYDVTTDTGGGGSDAGPDTYVPPPKDSGTKDTGPQLPDGKLIILHASPDAPAFRFCYGLNGTIANTVPAPNVVRPGMPYAGLFPGQGGPLPDLIPLDAITVTPYLILATKVAGETPDGGPDGGPEDTCEKLVGASGSLTANVDYFKIADIPAGTVLKGTTTLGALVGCFPQAIDAQANAAKCGSDYNATTGNLHLTYFKLDRTVADATKTGAQVIHAASAWSGLLGAMGGTGQMVVIAGQDGGPVAPPLVAAPGVAFGAQTPDASASLDPAVFAPTNYFTVITPNADGGAPINTAPFPIPVVAYLTNGHTPPGTAEDGGAYFTAGKNYAFVLLGDPTAEQLALPDGGQNPNYVGQGLHVVAFPTDPDLPTQNQF